MPKFRIGKPPNPKKPNPVGPKKTAIPLFEQLLNFSWRGIALPVSSIEVELSQDMVEHRSWRKAGAAIEATGLAPLQIEAEIPFLNSVVAGKGEKWDGALYPTVFRKFVASFKSDVAGKLIHPEFGSLTCKPKTLHIVHSSERRDGVVVKATWIETNEQENVPNDKSPPVISDISAAKSLDASATDLRSKAPQLPVYEESFESALGKAAGYINQQAVTIKRIGGQADRLLYRVEGVANAVDNLREAALWPVKHATTTIKDRLHNIKTSVAPSSVRKLRSLTTTQEMTMSTLLSICPGNSADDLLRLNPGAFAKTPIPRNTRIFYYV